MGEEKRTRWKAEDAGSIWRQRATELLCLETSFLSSSKRNLSPSPAATKLSLPHYLPAPMIANIRSLSSLIFRCPTVSLPTRYDLFPSRAARFISQNSPDFLYAAALISRYFPTTFSPLYRYCCCCSVANIFYRRRNCSRLRFPPAAL